jgi:uncharacterized membrane protein
VTQTETSHSTHPTPTDAERWYAAAGYLFVLCFLAMSKGRESAFVRFHARQAFLLFVSECIALILIVVIDQTVGRLPILGLLIVVLAQLVVYLSALFLSVMGFVKSLFGEHWEMPVFGAYGERLPILI